MIHTGIIGGASAITGIMGGSDSLNGTNTAIDAITDKGLTDVRGHKSGAFNSSSFEDKHAYSKEMGSNIFSGGETNLFANKDVNIAGIIESTRDINIDAGNNITENALKFTTDDYTYHHVNKTGFFSNPSGMNVQVGNKKITDQNRNSSTLWQGSMINSTEGSVNANAAKDINVNGSMIYANKDINMSGDTVNFNTVQNIVKGDQKHKDSFTGLTAGVDTKSIAGGMAGLGLAAANSTSKTTILTNGIKAGYAGIDTGLGKAGIKDQAIKGNMAPQEIDKINKVNKNNSSAANYNLVGAYASIGHSSNKSHLTTESTRDTGSVLSAGGKVSINAGSITGTISRDPDAANGYLADRFDANKIDSNFKKQNEITQTINTISDAIINTVYNDKKPNRDNHAQSGNALKPNGGKGTNVTATPSGEISDRDIMKMGASGIASITGAALGGGDVGATVAGVAAADAVNTELPNIGQVIADKIAPPVENPLKPSNKNEYNNGITSAEKSLQTSSSKGQKGNVSQKNPTYDETNDLNKLIAGMTQNVIVGGSGALAGIATSGDNMSLDATAGGLMALKQNAPNISNPDLKHARKPRDQDGRSRNPLKPMTSSQGQKASSQKGNQNDKI